MVRARQAGARIVVVSNWDVSLHEVLERVGLAPLVDGVVTSAAVGAAKPAAAIFAHALGLAGVAPERAIHVGDSLDEDVRGAAACGIRPMLLRRDGRSGAPDPAGVVTDHRLDAAGLALTSASRVLFLVLPSDAAAVQRAAGHAAARLGA